MTRKTIKNISIILVSLATILLLTSYVLFIVTRKVKMKFDFIPNILFFLNGLFIVVLLVIYMTELVKHLQTKGKLKTFLQETNN